MKIQAAQLRKELKASFSNVKFSVTSDAYSISVKYEDGPGASKVTTIANKFRDVDYDSNGDILSGGNTFVSVIRNLSRQARLEFTEYLEYKNIDENDVALYSEKFIQLKNKADISAVGFINHTTLVFN